MFELILQQLMARYGHLSLDEMKARLKEEGLGKFLDMTEALMENHPEIAKSVSQISPFGPMDDNGLGVMPPVPEVEALPIELDDDIFFDQKACLVSCAGNCCKSKNYLMISIADIYRIVFSSPAKKILGIHSTDDLFSRDPPLVQSFFNSEYGLYLPYIRFAPVDAEPDVPPENAPDSVCPFLFPIGKVYSFHQKELPKWANMEAKGCILMKNKPVVCRLSPVGKLSGLVTSRVSYVYAIPAADCPACETDVTIKLADYLKEARLPGERTQDERIHKILMKTTKHALDHKAQQRYNEILQQLYNIDQLLIRLDLDPLHRPGFPRLVEIGAHAAQGHFDPYDELVEELIHKSRNP